MPFAPVKLPNGKRALINHDTLFAYTEGEDGKTIAIALTGFQLPLGETFDEIERDMAPDEDGEDDEEDGRTDKILPEGEQI